MDNKNKIRAGLAAGLAGLAGIVGVASIASGQTATTTTPQAAPSGYAVPAADTEQPARTDDGRDCPKEDGAGQGAGGGTSEQAAPSATAPSTTSPDV